MIDFKGMTFSYTPPTELIPPLTGRWERGQIHVLIGPSGCGKSTLLNLLAGLKVPTAGEVFIKGETPLPGRQDTGVILQNHGLFPWKNVRENLALGLKIRRESRSVIDEKVGPVLVELGLEGKELSFPKELSGGERQRLAIGRALVLEPDLLLLDEPFSSLDAMTRERLQDRLWQLQDDRSSGPSPLTLVHVTHSIEEAVFLGDRIHIMEDSGLIRTLENKSPGPGYRKEAGYFENCVVLRRLFEEHIRGER